MKYYKNARTYLQKHPEFNNLMYTFCGIGIGVLLTYPIAGMHPVRFALIFLVLSFGGYLWAGSHKA